METGRGEARKEDEQKEKGRREGRKGDEQNEKGRSGKKARVSHSRRIRHAGLILCVYILTLSDMNLSFCN